MSTYLPLIIDGANSIQMKRILYITIMSLFCAFIHAQTLTVTSFTLNETDLTANLQGTMVLDQNGDKCALIKIVTTEQGFTFDVGSLGIAKTEAKTGEIWVYVPRGVRRITLNHQTYGRMEFPFSVPIQGSKTYEMVLKADKPVVSDEKQPLTIKVVPASAMLLVDDAIVETDNGRATVDLQVGNHSYNIAAKGYIGQSGTVTIKPGSPAKLIIELDHHTEEATALVAKKEEEEAKPAEPVTPQDKVATVDGTGEMFTLGKVQFLMVNVDHGAFDIGAHSNQKQPMIQERPLHEVTLTKDFAIGETEVTQELWKEIMGENNSYDQGSKDLPVEQVTWGQCQTFCKKLSQRTGRTFRLPTNAEWEFAARGGNKSKGFIYCGSDNADEVGWYDTNAENSTHEVKQKMPNELGLYDMSGNVWEWCQDNFGSYRAGKQTDPITETTDNRRVIRGGCIIYPSTHTRSSFRVFNTEDDYSNTLGLRVLMER